MTSREESDALINLQALMASDLSKADDETLVNGIGDAELTARQAREWTGRLVAELKRRDVSWSDLVRRTGLPQTTLHNRARPFT